MKAKPKKKSNKRGKATTAPKKQKAATAPKKGKQKPGLRRGIGRMLAHPQPERRDEVLNMLGRFARYMKQRREEKGMNLREFSEFLGMPFANIFQFEQLRKNPRLTELDQMARAMGEPLGAFLEPLLWPEPSDTPQAPLSVV
jgi:ribosome-binding protein aMBF1 (putative translation factor)